MRDSTGYALVTEPLTAYSTGTQTVFSVSFVVHDLVSVSVNGTTVTGATFSNKLVTLPTAAPANASVVIEYHTADNVYHYDLGQRASGSNVGGWSIVGGENATASKNYSVALGGQNNTASGLHSVAVGGRNNSALDTYSVVCGGTGNTAQQQGDVVLGGYGNTANGQYSAVLCGQHNETKGACSAVLGTRNKSSAQGSLAYGTYNDATNINLLEIVGNGTADNARSNARTLDKNGNETIAGALAVGDAATTRVNLGIAFASGDSFSTSYSWMLNGIVTSDAKQLVFDAELPKMISGVSVSVSSLKGNVRGVNGYVDGSSNPEWTGSAYTTTVTKLDGYRVRFTINKSTAFSNAANNTPVAFWGSFSLSFS